MPIKPLYRCLLLALLFWAGNGRAQDLPSDETFSQAKLAIWCETIYFIYQDYGADSLGQRLDCNSWSSFRESISPNYLQANTFFQSIEKPQVYEGYSSNEAKLGKLVDEITSKLKASPSRQNDPSRRQRVDSLHNELQQLAQNPVLFSGNQPGQEPIQDQDVEDGAVQEQPGVRSPAEAEEEEGFPWAELLQWLLIVFLLAGLAWLWNENRRLRKNISIRMARRKQEIAALEQDKLKPAPEAVLPPPADSLSREEVVQLIRSEMARQQKQQARQKEKQQSRAAVNAPPAAPAQKAGTEAAGNTMREVPQVQEEQASPGVYYDKLPFKGGFHHNQLSTQRQADSIYSIKVSGKQPDEAEFWVTEDAEVQKYAMENGLSFFEEACEYDQVEENPSRVRNLESGKLRRRGHLWQIEKKVKVSFE